MKRREYYFIPIALILALSFIFINFRMYYPSFKNISLVLTGVVALLCVLVSGGLFFVVGNWLINTTRLSVLKIVSILSIAIFFVLQILCIRYFRVNPSWDLGEVILAAQKMATAGPLENLEYFDMYPFNLSVARLIALSIRIFQGSQWAPYILNVSFITLSIIVVYKITKEEYNQGMATVVSLFVFLNTPLYLYASIPYTDTLSMPFPVLAIYLWLKFKKSENSISGYVKFLMLAGIGLISAVGFLLKPISAIPTFALIIDILFSKINRFPEERMKIINSKVVTLIIIVIAFISTINIYSYYSRHENYRRGISYDKSLPYFHWIMLGLNKPYDQGGTSYGFGGFSSEDLSAIMNYATKEEKKEYALNVINERLDNFGLKGYLFFLSQKLEWTWTDGTFYAPIKLKRGPVGDYKIHKYVFYTQDNLNKYYLAYTQVLFSIMLLLMLITVLHSLFYPINQLSRVILLSFFGVMLFLMLWESRSRYLTSFIPLFCIMSGSGLQILSNSLSILKHKFLTRENR